MRLGSVRTNLMTSSRASRCVGVAWVVVETLVLVVVAPGPLTGRHVREENAREMDDENNSLKQCCSQSVSGG